MWNTVLITIQKIDDKVKSIKKITKPVSQRKSKISAVSVKITASKTLRVDYLQSGQTRCERYCVYEKKSARRNITNKSNLNDIYLRVK